MKIYVLSNYTSSAESSQAFGRKELNLVLWVDSASLEGDCLKLPHGIMATIHSASWLS